VLKPGGRLVVLLGARLLPRSVWLLPFVAVQRLVYGQAPDGDRVTYSGARDGFLVVLDTAGFVSRSHIVRGPFWQAHVYIAEKSDSARE